MAEFDLSRARNVAAQAGNSVGADMLNDACTEIESLREKLAAAKAIEDDRENLAERLEAAYERVEAAEARAERMREGLEAVKKFAGQGSLVMDVINEALTADSATGEQGGKP